MVTVIIAAAGQGKRMGSEINKVFIKLQNQPVLIRSVQALSACAEVDNLVVVAAPGEVAEVETMLSATVDIKPWTVTAGGSERQYSIENALAVTPEEAEVILVHDAARPLIDPPIVSTLISAARQYKAAGVAVPVKDTIKTVDQEGFITGTPARHTLWAIQTPQAFDATVLRQAYQQAAQDNYVGTDDASLVERLGIQVKIVEGSYRNIKITTPEDVIVAEALLESTLQEKRNKVDTKAVVQDKGCGESLMRVGMGYDVHRLVEGRELILGGVKVPYVHGLEGHSDADVLLHAIKDAMLGAAALGDIGRHFPDTDQQYKGASSIRLLSRVAEILAEHGYQVHNVDATVVAEKPKLAPYIQTMNENIARTLAVDIRQVNVKATTTEGLGFAGKREGMAAHAIVSIIPLTK